MKHDSIRAKQIKAYTMRRKRGVEANRFERDMFRDPFLFDAVSGFDNMLSSDIQQVLDEADDALDRTALFELSSVSKNVWFAVGAMVIAAVAIWLTVAFLGKSGSQKQGPSDLQNAPRSASKNATEPLKEDEPLKGVQPQVIDDPKIVALPEAPIARPMQVDPVRVHTATPSAVASNTDTQKSEAARNSEKEATRAQTNDKQPQIENKQPEQAHPEPTPLKSETLVKPPVVTNAFRDHVRNNIRKSDGMPQGIVMLSFDVDKDGRPKKIKVEKSLCTACDAEAIRLLQTGPAWRVADKKERGTVEVPFR